MSKTIDQRVVEMRFDNKHFENNVQTSLSTLDKLKHALRLDGASKGLENVSSAAKNCNLSPISSAVESVKLKFSALEVMAVTALANITNSAINAGKRIVSALAIDPIKTGLSEYETKINAIQVIKANTRGKNTMDDITKALDELNVYADKTIYNYAQMTSNIGKFVAQGLDVQQATNAVKGMANLAAASGASAEDMARATYQMSQALGGVIRKIDWNSLRTANMATTELKSTLIDLAKVHGIAIDDMIKQQGTFEDTLEKGWLTGDLFTEAMNIYSGIYSDAELKAKGFTDSQIANFKDLAKTAEEAATEVKTFTQLWDVLKETAQSGWTQTWELLIGDFDTAKKDLTELQNYFSDIINAWSDARNFLIEGAMNIAAPWEKIKEKLSGSGLVKSAKKVSDTIDDVSDKLERFQNIVNKVWRGDFGNSDTGRYELLEKAGYDHRVVQDLVNKGYQYKLTIEDIEASHKKFGLTMDKTSTTTEKTTDVLSNLTDEQLKNAGLTEEEIRLYRDLAEEADRTGVSIEELVDKMSKKDGRTLLVDSLKNAWAGIVKIFNSVKKAWSEIFPPMSIVKLYGIIEAINKFSEKLIVSDTTAEKITTTFKGLFAALDLIFTLTGGGLKIAFEVIKTVLDVLGISIWDVTAYVGDAILQFRNWIKENEFLQKAIEFIVPHIQNTINAVRDWIVENDVLNKSLQFLKSAFEVIGQCIMAVVDAIRKWIFESGNFNRGIEAFVDGIMNIVPGLKEAAQAVKDWFEGLKDVEDVPKYLIEGLINGILAGIPLVVSVIVELAKTIIRTMCEILGIHSPSTEGFYIGENFILGIIEGLGTLAKSLYETVINIVLKMVDYIKSIDFGTLIGAALSAGLVVGIARIGKALLNFSSLFEGLGDMFEGIGDAFEGLGKALKGIAFKKRAEGILSLAIAIGILAAAIYVLGNMGDSLWTGLGAIIILATVLGMLAAVANKMSAIETVNMSGIVGMILAVSGALLLVSFALKNVNELNPDSLGRGIAAIIALSGIVVGLIAATNLYKAGGKNISKMLIGISAALFVMTMVVKQLGEMDEEALVKGIMAITYLAFLIEDLILVTKKAGNAAGLGSALVGVSVALGAMTLIVNILGNMNEEVLLKGIVAITYLSAIIAGLITATGLAGKNTKGLSATLLGVSAAILVIGLICKTLGEANAKTLAKGIGAITILSEIIVGLIAATRLASDKEFKMLGANLLLMSISIGILGLIAVLLGSLSIEQLVKGVAAVGILSLIMDGMILAAKGANDCKANLIAMTVAIGVMAAAIAALSFIETDKLIVATGAMALLMGMFAIIEKAGSNVQSSIKTIIVMTVAIGILAAMLFLLSMLPLEATLASAAALSLLVVALSASLIVLAAIGNHVAQALKGILALTAMVAPLLVFVGVLCLMDGLQNALDNVLALTILTGALTLMLIPLTVIGAFTTAALLGVLALTTIVIPLVAFVGILYLMEGLQNATANVILLTSLLTTITGVLVVLALIGPLAIIGVTAMTGLTVLMGAVATFAISIGALMEWFPSLEDFLNKGIPILEKLAYAVGSMIGNFVAGFSDALMQTLPKLGLCLSDFMDKASGFITGAKNVDDKVLAGVGILAASVLALTAADLISGIASLLSFGSSFADLGSELSRFIIGATPFIIMIKQVDSSTMEAIGSLTSAILMLTAASLLDGIRNFLGIGSSLSEFVGQLVPFGEGVVAFSNELKKGNIDTKAVEAASKAGEMMAVLAEKIPASGDSWMSAIFGKKDLGVFGAQMKAFAEGIVGFSNTITENGGIDADAVQAASDAGTMMATLAEKIPRSGTNVMSAIFGDQDLGVFGAQMKAFAQGVVGFSNVITENGGIDSTAVEAASNAGTMMAELANKIPESGTSVMSVIFGEQSLDTFGQQMAAFGRGVVGFSNAIKDGGGVDTTAVQAAYNAGSMMANLANTLPEEDGFFDIFAGGKTTIEEFGTQLVSFGKSIKAFSDEVKGIATNQVYTASVSARTLATMASELPDDVSNLDVFGSKLTTFGDNIASYFAKVEVITQEDVDASTMAANSIKYFAHSVSSEKVDGAVNAVDKLVKAVKGMATIKENSTDGFIKTFDKLAKVNVDSFIQACESAYPKLKNIGTKFIDNLKDGISERSSAATKIFKTIAENLVKVIKNQAKQMKEAGNLIISKFVEGIRDKASNATRACKDVASDCESSIRDKYTEFYYAGKYMVEGFADGIEGYTFMAESAAKAMVNAAIKAAEEAADENSPSKETYRIGKFFEMGFSNAISDRLSNSYKTGYEMADYAKKGLTRAVSNIKDILESDIDTQPTIRPILDLSSVESSAGKLNGMLNLSPSVGVLSNVGAINSMMNQRIQNGGSDDVVSAIRDLGKQLGNSSGDSYYIDGVTYDDGSNISNAVKSLVRAARVERRR